MARICPSGPRMPSATTIAQAPLRSTTSFTRARKAASSNGTPGSRIRCGAASSSSAACALAAEEEDAAPHLILLPGVPFDEAAFLARVKEVVERSGACAIVVAEGIRGPDGQILAMLDRNQKGYVQLGGAGEVVAERIHSCLGYKVHYALADYLQRSARHLASKTDTAQAAAVGKAAVRRALAGQQGVVGIERVSDAPYRWRTNLLPFAAVANLERRLPAGFIAADGFGVTEAFRTWCRPLIAGEDWPVFRGGLPDYLRL